MDELFQCGSRVVVTSNFPAECARGVVYGHVEQLTFDHIERIAEGKPAVYYQVVFYALEGVGVRIGLYPAQMLQKDTQPIPFAHGNTFEVGERMVRELLNKHIRLHVYSIVEKGNTKETGWPKVSEDGRYLQLC